MHSLFTHHVQLYQHQLLRRQGTLEDAPTFIKAAERHSSRAAYDAGLYYCKGLFAWYGNKARDALEQFNHGMCCGPSFCVGVIVPLTSFYLSLHSRLRFSFPFLSLQRARTASGAATPSST
jgi:hypothetical protein